MIYLVLNDYIIGFRLLLSLLVGIVLKGLLLTEKLKGKGCGSRPP